MTTSFYPKSKTLTQALNELGNQFTSSSKATISDLAEQLVYDLPNRYNSYLPYGKDILKLSMERQKNGLYCATYLLVDASSLLTSRVNHGLYPWMVIYKYSLLMSINIFILIFLVLLSYLLFQQLFQIPYCLRILTFHLLNYLLYLLYLHLY